MLPFTCYCAHISFKTIRNFILHAKTDFFFFFLQEIWALGLEWRLSTVQFPPRWASQCQEEEEEEEEGREDTPGPPIRGSTAIIRSMDVNSHKNSPQNLNLENVAKVFIKKCKIPHPPRIFENIQPWSGENKQAGRAYWGPGEDCLPHSGRDERIPEKIVKKQ